jgi:hypothetical protein
MEVKYTLNLPSPKWAQIEAVVAVVTEATEATEVE